MKTLLVLSFVLAAGVQAGSQTCHLKSGAGPLSQFTVNYEISHDAAALQHSSVVAVHSRHGDQGREATYLAAGENANLNLTVIALDEALLGPMVMRKLPFMTVARFRPKLRPFWRPERRI
jgi:hypothetical protein